MNCELPDIQAGFRKGRGTRDQIANTWWITERSKRVPEKTSTSALLTTPKPLTVWITTNCENLLKDGNTTLPYLCLERIVCRSRCNT